MELFITKAYAICPVCTAAAALGIGLSRWLGIDDTISGIWIGGLLASASMWLLSWLKSKKYNFFGDKIAVPIVAYASVLVPLYYKDIIGHPLNKLWGIDKLILGIAIGSAVFLIGAISYNIIKVKNNNKPHFSYQKIVMPIAPLIILSAIFYFITKG